MSAYQRGIKPIETEEQPLYGTDCIAHGCPMPGVFRTKMTGPSPSICRAHDGIAAKDWPEVTNRVRQREKALLAAIDLTNAIAHSDPEERYVTAFVRSFGETFARRKKTYGLPGQLVKVRGEVSETARDYGQRVYLMLLDQVRAGLEPHAVDLRKLTQDTWKQATEVV